MLSGKYAEDYRLENVPDGKGRMRTVPVYRGSYFRFSAPPEAVAGTRRRYALLSLLCFALSLVPLLLRAESMGRWYAALPAALCLPASLGLLAGARRLLTAGEKVTREHRDKIHDRYALWSAVLLGLSCLALAGQAVCCVRFPSGLQDYIVTGCTALDALAAGVLFTGKKALVMEELPSQ